MLNTGRATPEQVRGWVANRYYYQIAIPIKDAAVLSNCPDQAVRRGWVQRILDHDGFELNGVRDAGGIEAWLRLAEAVGLSRDEVTDLRHVVPGVRFAVDAYVNFARRAPWQEAVCSSLTELFAPEIHKQRLATWPEHYPWIESEGLHYFRSRVSQARRDVEQGLEVTLAHFKTPLQQERAPRGAAVQARHPVDDERRDRAAIPMSSLSSADATSQPRVGQAFAAWEAVQDCHVLPTPRHGQAQRQRRRDHERCDASASIAGSCELEQDVQRARPAPSVAFVEMAGKQRWLAWDDRMSTSLASPARRCGCWRADLFAARSLRVLLQPGRLRAQRTSCTETGCACCARAASSARAVRPLGRRAAGARRPRADRRRGAPPGLLHQPADLGRRAHGSAPRRL
jgi:pyrroloquinoline-quinone synthase